MPEDLVHYSAFLTHFRRAGEQIRSRNRKGVRYAGYLVLIDEGDDSHLAATETCRSRRSVIVVGFGWSWLMSRPDRAFLAGAVYHVSNWLARGERVFGEEQTFTCERQSITWTKPTQPTAGERNQAMAERRHWHVFIAT